MVVDAVVDSRSYRIRARQRRSIAHAVLEASPVYASTGGRFVNTIVGIAKKKVNACGSAFPNVIPPIHLASVFPWTAHVFAQFDVDAPCTLEVGDLVYRSKDGMLAIENTAIILGPSTLDPVDTYAIPMVQPTDFDDARRMVFE